MTIIRTPTEEERKDFTNIGFKEEVAKQEFEDTLAKEVQKAVKKGLPFAEKVVRDEFKDYYEQQIKVSIRKNGYLVPSEIKPLKIDWAKYSDLKNFDLLDEGEISDTQLAKSNPGLDVKVAFKKYQFKGYKNTYVVMEDAPSAIQRARKKIRELEGKEKK